MSEPVSRLYFHYQEDIEETHNLPAPPSLEQRLWLVNPDNPTSPFYSYVGQPHAKTKLGRAVAVALSKPDHLCREISWLLTGPSSVGKTTLARVFAKCLQIPMIEISPKAVSSLQELIDFVCICLNNHETPLAPEQVVNRIVLPPCIIFIDEVHALKNSLQQGLLKAVESKDSVLHTEKGEIIDCFNVCWMIATTDCADLFDAFQNRFCEIKLRPYTRSEISDIIKVHNEDFEKDTCDLISKFEPRIPRKALEFARDVKMLKSIYVDRSPEDLVKIIAEENGLDESGLHKMHVQILKILSRKPTSRDRLATQLSIRTKELDSRIMPSLIADTPDLPALVGVSQQGYLLTQAGYDELKRRNPNESKPYYIY
jgi:Holliday junction resolvasome RuvABC ATP-dependent DNA helicase subunit